MAEENKLATQAPAGALETVPEFMRGAEVDESHLEPDEIRMPRLAIAQAMSPQMTPNDTQFMGDDLRLYDMFNDVTQEVYGGMKTVLHFVPIVREVSRVIFGPDKKTIIERDLRADDPRNNWTTDEQGNRYAPEIVKFVNFISLLLKDTDPIPEPIAISIRLSNKLAKRSSDRLTMFIEQKKTQRRIPTYGGVYTVSVKPGTLPKGTFGVFHFQQAGLVQNKDLFEAAKRLADSLVGKTIIVQSEAPTGDEDDSFDTAAMDATAAVEQQG